MRQLNPNICYYDKKGRLVILTSRSFELGWATYNGFINPISYDKRIVLAYVNHDSWNKIWPLLSTMNRVTIEDAWALRQLWVGRMLTINRISPKLAFYVERSGGRERIVSSKQFVNASKISVSALNTTNAPKLSKSNVLIPYTTLVNTYEDEYSITILVGKHTERFWFLSGPDISPNPIGYDRNVVDLFLRSDQYHNKFYDFLPYVKLFNSNLSELSEDELWHFWRYEIEAVNVSKNTCFTVSHNGYKEYVEYLNKNREILRVNG